MKLDQANTPTHVVILLQEHFHANAFEHTLQLTGPHVHHKLQSEHIWKSWTHISITNQCTKKISPEAHISFHFSQFWRVARSCQDKCLNTTCYLRCWKAINSQFSVLVLAVKISIWVDRIQREDVWPRHK